MTRRRLLVYTCVAGALALLLGSLSRIPAAQAQVQPVGQAQAALDPQTARDLARIIKEWDNFFVRYCKDRCWSNYVSCVEFQMQADISRRLPGKPERAPGRADTRLLALRVRGRAPRPRETEARS